jgi:hypothetical protein
MIIGDWIFPWFGVEQALIPVERVVEEYKSSACSALNNNQRTYDDALQQLH